tara:strand:- start:99 stop:1022 length:924 start_codon:yes stop_codon:yes gene_type:complete
MRIKGEKGVNYKASTIETIDSAIFKFLQDMNLHAMTNKGFIPVPIIWVGAERTYQIKNDLTLRDSEGLLKLPLLTIERKDITKDPTKSPIPANIPDLGHGGFIPVRRRINQDKTSAFKSAQNSKKSGADLNVGMQQSEFPKHRKIPTKVAPMFNVRPENTRDKVVYETTYIPIPVYVTVKYEIHIRTEYQQQMNHLLTPFIAAHSRLGRNHRYFSMKYDNHTFEGFIDPNFSNDNNAAKLEEEERIFNTVVNVEVLGYLVGGDANEDSNIEMVYENVVEVKISRERVILADEFDRSNPSGSNPFYKE